MALIIKKMKTLLFYLILLLWYILIPLELLISMVTLRSWTGNELRFIFSPILSKLL